MTDKTLNIPKGTNVLVTGATGFTGQFLVRKLHSHGLKISAIARSSSDLSTLSDINIEWHITDDFNEDVLQKAVKNQDYIFHLAAALREAKSTENDYWNVHVESTKTLCKQAIKQKHFKRYIHISTIGVHGHIENPPADEKSKFAPGDSYQRTKLEAEQWLRKFASDNNFPFTIIRPAAIYGPGDKRLLKLFKMALKPYFLVLGKGKCMYHLVHVEDLTNAIFLSASKTEALGEEFIIGANNPISIISIAKIISKQTNKSFKLIRLPITPIFILAYFCEIVCKLLKTEPFLYRRRVAFYSKDRHFDVSKMRDVLGYYPKFDNEKGIIETYNWYKKHKWIK